MLPDPWEGSIAKEVASVSQAGLATVGLVLLGLGWPGRALGGWQGLGPGLWAPGGQAAAAAHTRGGI